MGRGSRPPKMLGFLVSGNLINFGISIEKTNEKVFRWRLQDLHRILSSIMNLNEYHLQIEIEKQSYTTKNLLYFWTSMGPSCSNLVSPTWVPKIPQIDMLEEAQIDQYQNLTFSKHSVLCPIYKKKNRSLIPFLFILPFTIPKERRLIRFGFLALVWDMMMGKLHFALHSAFLCFAIQGILPIIIGQTLFLHSFFDSHSCTFRLRPSSSSAVRTARDIVADFGENLAELSGGIASLAKNIWKKTVNENCHRLMVHRF